MSSIDDDVSDDSPSGLVQQGGGRIPLSLFQRHGALLSFSEPDLFVTLSAARPSAQLAMLSVLASEAELAPLHARAQPVSAKMLPLGEDATARVPLSSRHGRPSPAMLAAFLNIVQ